MAIFLLPRMVYSKSGLKQRFYVILRYICLHRSALLRKGVNVSANASPLSKVILWTYVLITWYNNLLSNHTRWPKVETRDVFCLLYHQVVLLSNSDIAFDESLARLGDPSTLDMAHKVRAERIPSTLAQDTCNLARDRRECIPWCYSSS